MELGRSLDSWWWCAEGVFIACKCSLRIFCADCILMKRTKCVVLRAAILISKVSLRVSPCSWLLKWFRKLNFLWCFRNGSSNFDFSRWCTGILELQRLNLPESRTYCTSYTRRIVWNPNDRFQVHATISGILKLPECRYCCTLYNGNSNAGVSWASVSDSRHHFQNHQVNYSFRGYVSH